MFKSLDDLAVYAWLFRLKFDFTAKLHAGNTFTGISVVWGQCFYYWLGLLLQRASFFLLHSNNARCKNQSTASTIDYCNTCCTSSFHMSFSSQLETFIQLEFKINFGFLHTSTYIVVFPLYTLRAWCSFVLISDLIHRMDAFDFFLFVHCNSVQMSTLFNLNVQVTTMP